MVDIKRIEEFYKEKENREAITKLKENPKLLKKILLGISKGKIKNKEDLENFLNKKSLIEKLINSLYYSFPLSFLFSFTYPLHTPTIEDKISMKIEEIYKKKKINFIDYFEIYEVTSKFNEVRKKGKYGGKGKIHKGIDFVWKNWEDRKIKAFMDGKVVYVGFSPDYGKHIITKHKIPKEIFGKEYLYLLYAHCSNLYKRPKDTLYCGSFLAKMGKTGKANGIHLHLEARLGEDYKNKNEIINLQPLNFEWILERIKEYNHSIIFSY